MSNLSQIPEKPDKIFIRKVGDQILIFLSPKEKITCICEWASGYLQPCNFGYLVLMAILYHALPDTGSHFTQFNPKDLFDQSLVGQARCTEDIF